jgi:hypothetical protein
MPRPSPAAFASVLCAFALACLPAGCDGDAAAPEQGSLSGVLLVDTQLSEISGLAVSRRHDDVLWLLDDGGNPARLFAINDNGDRLATVRVEGVAKTDWEDLAAFRMDGKDYLLIADTGDNGGLRRTLLLHVVEEPAQVENARVRPAWSIAFRWPDGPRDCEAVTVDAERGRILLVSKKRQPPELFSLPLQPARGVQTATLLGKLAGVPVASDEEQRQNARQARIRHQVTAADFSPAADTLAVMTYHELLLYRREGDEDWGRTVSRPARIHELPWLPQAEAVGWTEDGRSLYATGEFVPAPMYRITP